MKDDKEIKNNDIKKALAEIATAIENNETVESVKVIINLKKQKPTKTN